MMKEERSTYLQEVCTQRCELCFAQEVMATKRDEEPLFSSRNE